MKSIYILAPLTLVLQGCSVMSSKQLVKQQELWQNIGRISGYLECSQQMIGLQVQSLIDTKEKLEKIQAEKVKENTDGKSN